MTRRERLEAKVAKREEWAAGRRDKAATIARFTEQFRGDHAFNTQPGHIPLRARVIRMEDKAHEHQQVAQHHDIKAAGLEAQLDRSVFSDDTDAIQALWNRIGNHELQRERMKLVNKLYKKGDAAGLAAFGLDLEALTAKLAAAGPYWGGAPHLPYEMTNLGARIRADRERIEQIRARAARVAQAEQAGGVVIDGGEGGEYCRVTFAEKPSRDVLDALRAAGFIWGGGSWVGRRALLPVEVTPC